jgi:hypothetical protein
MDCRTHVKPQSPRAISIKDAYTEMIPTTSRKTIKESQRRLHMPP